MNTESTKRSNAVDLARCIALFAIILGHLSSPDVNRVVYPFSVPVFYLITGWFFREEVHPAQLIRKKARTLLLPYVITALALTAVTVFVQKYIRMSSGREALVQTMLAALYGSGSDVNSPVSVRAIGAIWFLLASFWGQLMLSLLFWFPFRGKNTLSSGLFSPVLLRPAIVVLLLQLSVVSARHFWLPFSIQAGGPALFYMYTGWMVRKLYDALNTPSGSEAAKTIPAGSACEIASASSASVTVSASSASKTVSAGSASETVSASSASEIVSAGSACETVSASSTSIKGTAGKETMDTLSGACRISLTETGIGGSGNNASGTRQRLIREAAFALFVLSCFVYYRFTQTFSSFWLVRCNTGHGMEDIMGSLCASYVIFYALYAVCRYLPALCAPLCFLGRNSLLMLCVHAIEQSVMTWEPLKTATHRIGLSPSFDVTIVFLGKSLLVCAGTLLLIRVRKYFHRKLLTKQ